jgi:DNA-binding transcriptional MocR family regulator
MRKLDKAKREASKLKSWFNPDPEQLVENKQPGRELILDRVNLDLNVTEKPKEPASFDEACNNSNLEERAKWRDAIQRELKEMKDKGVYKKIETNGYSKLNGMEYFGHDL